MRASEPGNGTSFKIYLPRAEVGGQPAPSVAEVKVAPRGHETVLLVEDEEAVREVKRRILARGGYSVLEARDGNEALRVASRHQGPIHLLVTDVVMPGMSGPQLAELLARERPELRVLFVSGYADEAITHWGVPQAGSAFLQKPFNPVRLARNVREVLDRDRADRR